MVGFKLLKNKYYWIVILIASIMGSIISIIRSKIIENKVQSSPLYLVVQYHNYDSHPIVFYYIEDSTSYKKLVTGKTNSINFKFNTIPDSSEVRAIGYSADSTLVKIIFIPERDPIKMRSHSDYNEYWIYHKFLVKP